MSPGIAIVVLDFAAVVGILVMVVLGRLGVRIGVDTSAATCLRAEAAAQGAMVDPSSLFAALIAAAEVVAEY